MTLTVYWQWGFRWVSRTLETPISRSKLNFFKGNRNGHSIILCCKVLKYRCASEPLGGFVKPDCWGPLPEFLIEQLWGEVQKCAFLNKFQGDADAAGRGLDVEKHRPGRCSAVLPWRQWGRRPSWFPAASQNLLLLSNSEFPHCVRCSGSALPGRVHCFYLFFICITERWDQIPRSTESEFRISVLGG